MRSIAQQKPLDLQRGVFLIRYESAEDTRQPPKVAFTADPMSAHVVDFVLPSDVDKPVLWSPGGSLVVRLSAPGRLLVEVVARFEGGSAGARIQSTLLSTDPLGMAWLDDGGGVGTIDLSSIRLLGHLAGRGDVAVPQGEWLGGPVAPTRIEGIGIDWVARPQSFGLRHSVRVGGGGESRATDMIDAGGYSGTRGRALPVVGATFELSGSATSGYEIVADALFLGSPQMRVSGPRVVISGPTGREPLVGLRLQIASTKQMHVPTSITELSAGPVSPMPAEPNSSAASRGTSGRVRVFRSRATAGRS